MAYQLNLDWPEFLEKYWQKQPVVLKNAFPNFVDPITPDELAGLVMEPEVDSRLVSHANGKWQASNGPFEHFDNLGETGWSLLAQAVNHWHMPAAELVRPFRPHPALLHVDPFEPIIDEDLAPGDILYIPPGFPHDGFTHETALNYSVGFRGPNGRDLISSFADYALENDLGGEHYSDPDLTCREHPGRVEQYELDRIRQMMIDMISKPDDFTKWFGSFVSTPRHELDIAAAEPPYSADEVLDALQGGETLSRLSGLRVLNINGCFFINSEQLETADVNGADALSRYTQLGQAELGVALNNPAFVEELTGLINQGYWYFDE